MNTGGPLALITLKKDLFLLLSLPSPALNGHSPSQTEARSRCSPSQLEAVLLQSPPGTTYWHHLSGATRPLPPAPPPSRGWLSHHGGSVTALSKLQLVQLSILQILPGPKMKTNKRCLGQRVPRDFVCKPALRHQVEG